MNKNRPSPASTGQNLLWKQESACGADDHRGGTDGASEAQAAPADADAQAAAPAEPPKPAPKRVVAMRGDDRPGMKKAEPRRPGRGGKFGDRKDGPRGPGRPGDNKFEPRRDDRGPGTRSARR